MSDPIPDNPRHTEEVRLLRVTHNGAREIADVVAAEEPMEIRVVYGPQDQRVLRSLSITMRTPGQDEELAMGFLFSESIIGSGNDIESIQHRGTLADGRPSGNIVRVDLRPELPFDPLRLQRHFFTTSSCGVCGKASLELLAAQGVQPLTGDAPQFDIEVIRKLPNDLRGSQPTFDQTGGLHAAGLFSPSGRLLASREDVGRHNAVDKLIGHFLLTDPAPLAGSAMMISGRASFEIMQKALVGRIPVVVAVGAPSNLAVQLARDNNMTLIGFASEQRFNVYTGPGRVAI